MMPIWRAVTIRDNPEFADRFFCSVATRRPFARHLPVAQAGTRAEPPHRRRCEFINAQLTLRPTVAAFLPLASHASVMMTLGALMGRAQVLRPASNKNH